MRVPAGVVVVIAAGSVLAFTGCTTTSPRETLVTRSSEPSSQPTTPPPEAAATSVSVTTEAVVDTTIAPKPTTTTARTGVGVENAHRLTEPIVWDSLRRFVPAPPDVVPKVSAADVYRKSCNAPSACKKPPEMVFGIYTDEGTGIYTTGDSPSNFGGFVQTMINRPVWMLIWHNIDCPPAHGPFRGSAGYGPPPTTATTTPPPPLRCDTYSIVDSDTGDFLGGYTMGTATRG